MDPKQQFDDFRSAAAGYAAFRGDAGLELEFRGCCDAPLGGAKSIAVHFAPIELRIWC